jgi:hypothetical protein
MLSSLAARSMLARSVSAGLVRCTSSSSYAAVGWTTESSSRTTTRDRSLGRQTQTRRGLRRRQERMQRQRRPFHPVEREVTFDDECRVVDGVGGGGGYDGDLDELCRRHIDLDADDFAGGCRFLHQIALGNLMEVGTIIASRGQIVNFRDYDRRSEFVRAYILCGTPIHPPLPPHRF